jgi:hypothetical protein
MEAAFPAQAGHLNCFLKPTQPPSDLKIVHAVVQMPHIGQHTGLQTKLFDVVGEVPLTIGPALILQTDSCPRHTPAHCW